MVGKSIQVAETRSMCAFNILDKIPNPKGKPRYFRLHGTAEELAELVGFECHFSAIWNKPNSVNQRMFGSYPYPPTIILTPTHEMVCLWRKPGVPQGKRKQYPNNKIDKEWSGYALTIWNIPFVYNPKHQHPCPFPLPLVERILNFWSWPNEIIIDPFIGSGTTAIACLRTGRNYIGIELSQEYCDIAEKRIADTKAEMEEEARQIEMFAD